MNSSSKQGPWVLLCQHRSMPGTIAFECHRVTDTSRNLHSTSTYGATRSSGTMQGVWKKRLEILQWLSRWSLRLWPAWTTRSTTWTSAMPFLRCRQAQCFLLGRCFSPSDQETLRKIDIGSPWEGIGSSASPRVPWLAWACAASATCTGKPTWRCSRTSSSWSQLLEAAFAFHGCWVTCLLSKCPERLVTRNAKEALRQMIVGEKGSVSKGSKQDARVFTCI